jgi:hypothetical protein
LDTEAGTERIPEEYLGNQCVIGSSAMTLRFVIVDYVRHMQHHLDHVLARERIKPYPAAWESFRNFFHDTGQRFCFRTK